jgi:hypothetical protein
VRRGCRAKKPLGEGAPAYGVANVPLSSVQETQNALKHYQIVSSTWKIEAERCAPTPQKGLSNLFASSVNPPRTSQALLVVPLASSGFRVLVGCL